MSLFAWLNSFGGFPLLPALRDQNLNSSCKDQWSCKLLEASTTLYTGAYLALFLSIFVHKGRLAITSGLYIFSFLCLESSYCYHIICLINATNTRNLSPMLLPGSRLLWPFLIPKKVRCSKAIYLFKYQGQILGRIPPNAPLRLHDCYLEGS